ncbi:MAG: agmatinase [bacterium]
MDEPADPKQFMGQRSGKSTLERCRFIILPVPCEKTVSYGGGTAAGPKAIVKASGQLELWDEEVKRETWKQGICTLPPFDCRSGTKAFFSGLKKKTEKLLQLDRAVPFFLGGEHSITQALLPAFIQKYPGLSILHFDAHADLRSEYEGSSHSHACALYPASRKCRIVQAGIRSVAPEEKQNINSGNVKTFLMHEHLEINSLIKKVLSCLTKEVYLTIDVDGFDPSVIPGTGTPQPGGFSWHDGLKLFRAVCGKKKVVGVDVVETAPQKGTTVSEFAAAKLVYRLMGYLSEK